MNSLPVTLDVARDVLYVCNCYGMVRCVYQASQGQLLFKRGDASRG